MAKNIWLIISVVLFSCKHGGYVKILEPVRDSDLHGMVPANNSRGIFITGRSTRTLTFSIDTGSTRKIITINGISYDSITIDTSYWQKKKK